MEAIELLAKQLEQVQQSCNEMLELGGRTWQRLETMDNRLFGNGQPGEIDRNKTALAGVVRRVDKLETDNAEKRGAAQVWGALAGGLMWGVGIAFQWFWQKVRTGH